AAFVTGVTAGIATNFLGVKRLPVAAETANGASTAEIPGAPGPAPELHRTFERNGTARLAGSRAAVREVFTYGFRDLLDEAAHWLVLGVVLAALVAVLLPASVIERYFGGGFLTMLAMLVVGIPIYTCASASTPIAAALVLKGLSPGAALVFLLSGPATNIGAIVVLLKFLGLRLVSIYLASSAVVARTAARIGAMLAVAGVVLYLGSGLFTVHPGEVGIRTRFGRIVDSHLGPGLHARLPWPIEDHVLVSTDNIRRIEVGLRSPAQPAPGTQAQAWAGTGFSTRTARSDLFW